MIYNASSEKSPESLMRVRFQDCDPFGHLNNARYAEYFFDAREDHLRESYDLDLYAMAAEQRRGWLVRHTETAFLRPALQNEMLRIVTRLVDCGDASISVEGLMLDRGGRDLKAVLRVDFTHVDLDRNRPARHSQELRQFFQAILYTEASDIETQFAERLQTLRKQVRSGKFERIDFQRGAA
ncbi:MAG: acyl-CoA thioesterase [Leptospirales bacterium]|nr:acyl-CoA thioesterase [Leptospirales bacterium]